MCRNNHGVAVDYFAVGVIAYECMMGRRPYQGKNRKEIRDQILARQVTVKREDIPDGWSVDAATFINKVLGFFRGRNKKKTNQSTDSFWEGSQRSDLG